MAGLFPVSSWYVSINTDKKGHHVVLCREGVRGGVFKFTAAFKTRLGLEKMLEKSPLKSLPKQYTSSAPGHRKPRELVWSRGRLVDKNTRVAFRTLA